MKLSEAIRLGSTLMPQCACQLHLYRDGVKKASCALGAAIDAMGSEYAHIFDKPHYKNFKVIAPKEWIFDTKVSCPGCALEDSFYRIVAHLNDKHNLTRESIADWVEICEMEDEINRAPVQPEVAVVELA